MRGISVGQLAENSHDADHPRACGELRSFQPGNKRRAGSSPRMRGTPSSHRDQAANEADHPRACGELEHVRVSIIDPCGSSPRMRELALVLKSGMAEYGSSPRMRGTPHLREHVGRPSPDHPRACGELLSITEDGNEESGSSPRMRGTLLDIVGPLCFHRIIPAHAGNSLPSVPAFGSHADHPRACGELPVTLNAESGEWRIIPAHAGNSHPSTLV